MSSLISNSSRLRWDTRHGKSLRPQRVLKSTTQTEFVQGTRYILYTFVYCEMQIIACGISLCAPLWEISLLRTGVLARTDAADAVLIVRGHRGLSKDQEESNSGV